MEFNSIEEEIDYWKERATNFENELLIVQEEFHNYEISSKELEQELELQLDDYEEKNKNLIILNEKLNIEYENIQLKLSETTKSCNNQLIELQDELGRVKGDKLTLQKYVRELEQTNDDLERSQRATVTSLEDFEQKLNIALEKNAILENELDEKEALVETVQRLKDEARDLRQDLQVKDLHMNQFQNNMSQQDKDALATSLIEEKDEPQVYHSNVVIQTDLTMLINNCDQPHTSFYNRPSFGQSNFPTNSFLPGTPIHVPLTPAARLSALNLVSDMLRKVGAIEHKLSSATQRGLIENDLGHTSHGQRNIIRHRMSESSAIIGYSRRSPTDSLDVTPLASPIRPLNMFDKSSRQMSQTVGE